MKPIAEIVRALGLTLEGDAGLQVDGISSLAAAAAHQLSFLTSAEFAASALRSKALALIAPSGVELPGKTILRSPHPMVSVVQAITLLTPPAAVRPGVHPTAVIGPGCRIADSATIGALAVLGAEVSVGPNSVVSPHVTIEGEVVLGADCQLYPGVVLHARTRLGDRVTVQSGSVIGAPGYGYIQENGTHLRIPHLGNVILEDDVEIGANNTIDRATFESTVIRAGTKTDNLVHIAHNVEIGPRSLILGQAGVAGSTKIGANFTISGQSGVADHLNVPDNVTVGPRSLLTRPGKAGEVYYGYPARPAKQWQRSVAALGALAKLPPGVLRSLSRQSAPASEDAAE